MSLFASVGKPKPVIGVKIERVKGALEHVALYVGLALYTAVGAKVHRSCFISSIGNFHPPISIGAKVVSAHACCAFEGGRSGH